MDISLRLAAVVVLAAGLLSSFGATPMFVEQVVNGDFEGGNTLGWTIQDTGAGGGSWFAYSGTTTPLTAFSPVQAPPGGVFAAITDMNNPGQHILFQDVAIPAGNTATFTATVYVLNRALDYFNNGTLSELGGPNQYMRVDIMDPLAPIDDLGAGVLMNLFITNPGDPLSIGYTPLMANLSAFAGTTVRIRIAEVDNQLFFHGAVDDISVDAVPAVPTLPQWALITLAVLLAIIVLRSRRPKLTTPV